MNGARESRLGRLATVLVLALLTGYVGGYFAMGNRIGADSFIVVREFRAGYVARAYWPLGWIEAKVRHRGVTTDGWRLVAL